MEIVFIPGGVAPVAAGGRGLACEFRIRGPVSSRLQCTNWGSRCRMNNPRRLLRYWLFFMRPWDKCKKKLIKKPVSLSGSGGCGPPDLSWPAAGPRLGQGLIRWPRRGRCCALAAVAIAAARRDEQQEEQQDCPGQQKSANHQQSPPLAPREPTGRKSPVGWRNRARSRGFPPPGPGHTLG